MATLYLKGFPQEQKKLKVLQYMQNLLNKNGIRQDFKVTCNDVPRSPFKSITIDFSNVDNAYKAHNILNNMDYKIGESVYKLTAFVTTDHNNLSNQRTQEPVRIVSYKENSSHLPMQSSQNFSSDDDSYSDYPIDGDVDRSMGMEVESESTQIDALLKQSIEMKLLRKKRMILEEEQKLLLEEKKLKLAQAGATSFQRGFKARQVQPPERPKPNIKQKNLSGRPFYERPTPNYLPKFTMPCHHIIRRMQAPISRYSTDKKITKRFKEIVTLQVRLRINDALKDQPKYMQPREIFTLYRSMYPRETDEEFVKTVALQYKDHLGLTMPASDAYKPKAKKKKVRGKKKGKQDWFIDTEGEGSSTNVNTQEVVVIPDEDNQFAEDYDLNDAEDWIVEDSNNVVQV